MCFGGGGSGGDGGAADARRREAARQKKITTGTQNIDSAFTSFTPEFFANQEKQYVDYAQPQLDDQFSEAKKGLVFALSKSGLLNSTAAADRQRKLQDEYARYQTDIANRAKSYSQGSRADLERARGDLIAQLTATEDPAAAGSSAMARAQLLSAPPAFDPVGTFAFDASSGLKDLSDRTTGYNGLSGSPLFSRSSGGGSVSYSKV